jgi:hypothetical protein
MTERVWTLHLNHSDVIEIYNTTTDTIIISFSQSPQSHPRNHCSQGVVHS